MKGNNNVDILVVDDEVEIADVIAELLRGEGYTVEVAYDGASGLECARKHQPRLLISDVRMPKIGGYELAARIRHSIADIRAIFISAISQALPPPPFGVLIGKPFNFDALLNLVEQVFKGGGDTDSGQVQQRSVNENRMGRRLDAAMA